MQLIFANSAFVSAPERLMRRNGSWSMVALRVRYGIILHPKQGVFLVDTGIGPAALSYPDRPLPVRAYAAALRYRLLEEEAPAAVLERLDLRPRDVAGVIVTHFHADHVARLNEFPMARIICHSPALRQIRAATDFANVRHGVFAGLIPAGLETRMACVTQLAPRDAGLAGVVGGDVFGDGSCLAVPLPGHAAWQFGLAFPQMARPLLYAVDTQWLLPALPVGQAPGWPARLIWDDPVAAGESTALACRWQQSGGQVMLCHDPDVTAFDHQAPPR